MEEIAKLPWFIVSSVAHFYILFRLGVTQRNWIDTKTDNAADDEDEDDNKYFCNSALVTPRTWRPL